MPADSAGSTATKVSTADLGFCKFSNMRAVYERPNSKFLDLAIRYTSNDRNRLKSFKRTMSLASFSRDRLICFGIVFLFFVLIGAAALVAGLRKVRLIDFPVFRSN